MSTTEPMHKVTDQPNYAYFGQRGDWLIVIAQHRDSGTICRSNFRVLRRDLERRFGDAIALASSSHFLVSWVETLLVNPAHEVAVVAAQEWREYLDDYILADEEDFSELEDEERDEEEDE